MKIVAKKKYHYPMGLEREYAKQLKGLTDDMFATIRKKVPQMVDLIKKYQIKLDDDDEPAEEIGIFMSELAALLILTEKADPYVRRMFDKVKTFSEKETQEIFASLFGATASLQGLRTEFAKEQIIREMSEEADRYNIELTEEEKVAIGTGILLSEMLSASEEKRKAIEEILRNRPAGADIIASSEAEIVLKAQKKLKILQEVWIKENLDLIGSLEAETLRKLNWKLLDLIARGVPEEDLREQLITFLRDELHVEENRAVLIGSDQVGKLNGRMEQYWQQSAGIEEYMWQTMEDDRVRELHRIYNRKIFRWDNPPSDGHPGEAIMCRCIAIPVLSTQGQLIVPRNGTFTTVKQEDYSFTLGEDPLKNRYRARRSPRFR